jgi:serine/threonine protein kinase
MAADVPGGLCPACLMKVGLASETLEGTSGGQKHAFTPPGIGELAARFPQLEILELIGRGGMGAVYKARQKELDRIAALKILPPDIGRDAAFADRFAREAKALAKLNHPGIVTIYEVGRADGLYFFLMEFVDGVSLRQLLERGRLSAREALAIAPQLCDALQYAHDQGIVHRDIKPENIMLDRRGRVKIADFGLAKLAGAGNGTAPGPSSSAGSTTLTQGGKIMGTPHYMAPEQIHHPEQVDHRADIYALGVVFYQMLTGELPAKRLEPPSSRVRGVHIDVRLDEVVLRALQREPERRYQQVSEVKTAVDAIAQTSPAMDRDTSSSRPAARSGSLSRRALVLGLAGVLALSACQIMHRRAVRADLAPEQAQARGQAILKQLIEVNRYWLLAPPLAVTNYDYNFHYFDWDKLAYGQMPIRVTTPADTARGRRQGVAYCSLIHFMARDPARVQIRSVRETHGQIILEVAPGAQPARQDNQPAAPLPDEWPSFLTRAEDDDHTFGGQCGNGIEGTLYGGFGFESGGGQLVIDAARMVPLKSFARVTGTQLDIQEAFSDYKEVAPGHLAPLSINVTNGDFHIQLNFKLHPGGLWLFDESQYRERKAAFVDEIQINRPLAGVSAAANDFISQQSKEAQAGSFLAKYNLWEAYYKGDRGVAKDAAKADELLQQLVKDLSVAKFEPANGFNPATPQEYLSSFYRYSRLESGKNKLVVGFFRTKRQAGKLIGSFLTDAPDKLRPEIERNPNLKLISVEKLTPAAFIEYEQSVQESL